MRACSVRTNTEVDLVLLTKVAEYKDCLELETKRDALTARQSRSGSTVQGRWRVEVGQPLRDTNTQVL